MRGLLAGMAAGSLVTLAATSALRRASLPGPSQEHAPTPSSELGLLAALNEEARGSMDATAYLQYSRAMRRALRRTLLGGTERAA